MAKRLQVILKDPEYREIQRVARSRRMSVAEWVRQVLDLARRRELGAGVGKKLDVIRTAVRHNFPSATSTPCSQISSAVTALEQHRMERILSADSGFEGI